MTDWLDDILDAHPGDTPPEGFAARVAAQARGTGRGRLLAFPRFAAASAAGLLLLAAGYWMGRGAPDLHDGIRLNQEVPSAALGVDEMWRDRELLESLDTLSAEELEMAFRDATAGTWLLDEALPVEENDQ
jgi:hypothetical protein